MIHVTVGRGHLQRLLAGRGVGFDKMLKRAFEGLDHKPYMNALTEDDLANTTVYEVLAQFHDDVACALESCPAILESLTDEIVATARGAYYQPEFRTSSAEVCHSLGVHDVFAHGTIANAPVYLPDFSVGGKLAGSFVIELPREASLASLFVKLFTERWRDMECHLCDDLRSAYQRAQVVLEQIKAQSDSRIKEHLDATMPGDSLTLIIDSLDESFTGYRSLRRDFPELQPVGAHRILSRCALRHGMAKKVVSRAFPMSLWSACGHGVRQVLLTAGEMAGLAKCAPIHPDAPSKEELDNAVEWLGAFHNAGESEECRIQNTLAKLGLQNVHLKRRIEMLCPKPGTWPEDILSAVRRFREALFADDVEQSLQRDWVQDLYPLHKRMLGLIEYLVIPKLKEKGLVGNASSMWSNAFTGWEEKDKNTRRKNGRKHPPLCKASLHANTAIAATLETEGNWLLYAGDEESAGRTGPIDLASLLDGIMQRMSSAKEVSGLPVTLTPKTPQDHAMQLRYVANSTNEAVCSTLYLGKIALMLRNAIEHGTDEVTNGALLIRCPDYWQEPHAHLDWNKQNALQTNWRHADKLSGVSAVPSAAGQLLLTPASLGRCLVLLSLVLHGAQSNLGITY